MLNLDKDSLYKLRITQGKTYRQMAKILHCNMVTIGEYLHKYNIPIHYTFSFDKQLIYNLYVRKKLTTFQISKKLNCSQPTISNYLHKYNIPARFSSKGKNNSHWKGGKIKTTQGYIDVYLPEHPNARKSYIREHRLVMEKKIGRYLERWEVVHHINGIKDDNRPENLELFPNSEHYIITKLISENKRLKEENKRLKTERLGIDI